MCKDCVRIGEVVAYRLCYPQFRPPKLCFLPRKKVYFALDLDLTVSDVHLKDDAVEEFLRGRLVITLDASKMRVIILEVQIDFDSFIQQLSLTS